MNFYHSISILLVALNVQNPQSVVNNQLQNFSTQIFKFLTEHLNASATAIKNLEREDQDCAYH